MAYGCRAAIAAAAAVIALAPAGPAQAFASHSTASGAGDAIVVAGDLGTSTIRFREEWAPSAAADGIPGPFVGAFDSDVVEFMGLQVRDERTYDVTAFDGVQSGEAELTVPAGSALDPGTYRTHAAATGTDVPGFFFHGYLGYAGYGTGAFTVLRSTVNPDTGELVSFLAIYDEVLTDTLGASHVVGVVSWADTGDVPSVDQVSAMAERVVTGRPVTIRGMLQSTAGPGGILAVLRISHGRTSVLPDVSPDPDGTFVLVDRPPCAGGVTYRVSTSGAPSVVGETVLVTIPLVRCTTAGGRATVTIRQPP
jgi:hypothetical protein